MKKVYTTADHLPSMIRRAFDKAWQSDDPTGRTGKINRDRSRRWVEALADEFRLQYAADPTIRVFSKHYDGNRANFRLNELLYDISVCRVASVPSARHGKELLYVAEPLWQVESEFKEDSREALIDFSKLVMGAAPNKLFIGPQVKDIPAFIRVLAPAASACSGVVFLALLPHPSLWKSGNQAEALLWRSTGNAWRVIQ